MTPAFFLMAFSFPPTGWEFRDEPIHAGRSVLTYRTVELTDKPAAPVSPDDRPPAGVRFGELKIGSGGKRRLGVVWHADTNALWVDADGDGRFAASEQHSLGETPVAVPVVVSFGDEKHRRTLLVRRRGDGLAYAVRGYTVGRVTLGADAFPAMLTDGDADGCFDGPSADRVWVDLNRDGRFDPLTEQFPAGRPVPVGKTAFLIRPDPTGLRVTVRERPAEAGPLTVRVSRLPGAEVVGLDAEFLSEWGELVTVTAVDAATPVPVGRYRVGSVRLRLRDVEGRVWEYRLYGGDRFVATVAKDAEASLDLTDGLRASVSVGSVPPSAEVEVTPTLTTAAGLTLSDCEVQHKSGGIARSTEAEVRLAAPGSEILAECRTCFRCGYLSPQRLVVPPPAAGSGVEAVVVVPTGPLAGEIRGWKELRPAD